MGAGQSSSGSTIDDSESQVKTSYYELLGVTRQATEDEIKKGYRRKALELHPDRNYGNEEEATRTFAEVQSAYEILSDPQERAWYDSHEAAILRGEDASDAEVHSYENIRVTTADDLARVVRKFNSNVEFTDSPSGFFGFLSEQFEHLAKEEEVAAAWENSEAREYPPFGHKDDAHEDLVKSFYSAWSNFSTIKSFAWKDKYRLSEAPDRRIRRLMEKENNNLRQEAIREFNEAVRAFALFVRKRDPRYQPSAQSETERQQVLRDAAAAQRARARATNQAKAEGVVPEWTQVRGEDESEESEEEEIEEEIVECVACNKTFKSEKQYEAHERSKKHQKSVSALQRKMQKENKNLHLDELVSASSDTADDQDWHVVDAAEADIPEDAQAESPHQDDNQAQDPADGQEVEHSEITESSEDEVTEALDNVAIHDEPNEIKTPERKLGKAAQKRAKKAAATSASEAHDVNHKCATCDATFPSRGRLFQHIKDHGHAALKTGGKNVKAKSKR